MKTPSIPNLILRCGAALACALVNPFAATAEPSVYPPEAVVQVRLAGVPGVYDAVQEEESGPFKPVELRNDLGGYVLAAPDFKTFLAMGKAAKPQIKTPVTAAPQPSLPMLGP